MPFGVGSAWLLSGGTATPTARGALCLSQKEKCVYCLLTCVSNWVGDCKAHAHKFPLDLAADAGMHFTLPHATLQCCMSSGVTELQTCL